MEKWNCKRLEFTILSVSENMKPVKIKIKITKLHTFDNIIII